MLKFFFSLLIIIFLNFSFILYINLSFILILIFIFLFFRYPIIPFLINRSFRFSFFVNLAQVYLIKQLTHRSLLFFIIVINIFFAVLL